MTYYHKTRNTGTPNGGTRNTRGTTEQRRNNGTLKHGTTERETPAEKPE